MESDTINSLTDKANEKLLNYIEVANVQLKDIDRASNKIEYLRNNFSLLHSGPPIDWSKMKPAMRGSACGAVVYEGWAANLQDAYELLNRGKIKFAPTNDNAATGPMSGIISPSMPVWVIENTTYGNEVYATVNEGLGKALRFGANSEDVIEKLKWIENVFYPIMHEALVRDGSIDLLELLVRGIQRGDEGHNRNKATTSLFFRSIASRLVRTSYPKEDIARTLDFIDTNDHFFLNLSMGCNKSIMDNTINIPHSTIVTCMASNGVDFGIKVAGLGNKWIIGPAPFAKANYFEGYTDKDASTIMGDSYISETIGLGGFSFAAALGICSFIGISVQDAINYTLDMYELTIAESRIFKIPNLEFRGTPLGIDIRKIITKRILPVLNAGIAHKEAGIGQVGAGVAQPPMICFEKAAKELGL